MCPVHTITYQRNGPLCLGAGLVALGKSMFYIKLGHFLLMSFAGGTTVIIVSIVSSLVLVVVGIAVGLYIWRQRSIAKKRRGKKFLLEKVADIDLFCNVINILITSSSSTLDA